MKNQALFSSKDKSKKIKVSSAAILLGSLRVKVNWYTYRKETLQLSIFLTDTQWGSALNGKSLLPCM